VPGKNKIIILKFIIPAILIVLLLLIEKFPYQNGNKAVTIDSNNFNRNLNGDSRKNDYVSLLNTRQLEFQGSFGNALWIDDSNLICSMLNSESSHVTSQNTLSKHGQLNIFNIYNNTFKKIDPTEDYSESVTAISPSREKILYDKSYIDYEDKSIPYEIIQKQGKYLYNVKTGISGFIDSFQYRFLCWMPDEDSFIRASTTLEAYDMKSKQVKKIMDYDKLKNLGSISNAEVSKNGDKVFIQTIKISSNYESSVYYIPLNVEKAEPVLLIKGNIGQFQCLDDNNILFSVRDDNNGGIYKLNINTKNKEPFAKGNIAYFKLSDDKSKIIYGRIDEKRNAPIYVGTIKNGNITSNLNIFNIDKIYNCNVVWSKSGTKLLLSFSYLDSKMKINSSDYILEFEYR
jgi:hypothetical protein